MWLDGGLEPQPPIVANCQDIAPGCMFQIIAIWLVAPGPAICPAPVPPTARDRERRTARTGGVSWAVRRLRPPWYETAISQRGPSYSDHERASWSTHNL